MQGLTEVLYTRAGLLTVVGRPADAAQQRTTNMRGFLRPRDNGDISVFVPSLGSDWQALDTAEELLVEYFTNRRNHEGDSCMVV